MPTPDASEFTRKRKLLADQTRGEQPHDVLPVYYIPLSALGLPNFLINDQEYVPPPLQVGPDILAIARYHSQQLRERIPPRLGETLVVNRAAIGRYEYSVFPSDLTVAAPFSSVQNQWFSNTKDTVSSWIIVNGNLTIDTGVVVTPPVRKLFTLLYVKGNLIVNGSISMDQRGANHSGTGDSGGFTAPADIRLASGTVDSITNPTIPATGGAGGAQRTTNGKNDGVSGSDGGTGGGGSGQRFVNGISGAGAAGTCFSGGSGGAGALGGNATVSLTMNGQENGGRGGDANVPGNTGSAGGAGNPGGASTTGNALSGTGGVVVIIVEGSLTGSGTIRARGQVGNNVPAGTSGGASGSGSITVFYGTNPGNQVSLDVSSQTSPAGGLGGAGSARKLSLV